jgi:hypothetical protein
MHPSAFVFALPFSASAVKWNLVWQWTHLGSGARPLLFFFTPQLLSAAFEVVSQHSASALTFLWFH